MGAEMSWSRTVLLPSSPDYDILISTLEAESQVLIDWFKDNKMQANPDKFQVLAVGKKTFAVRYQDKSVPGQIGTAFSFKQT
jgi:hypothetical protein